jgi:hypothetical protein
MRRGNETFLSSDDFGNEIKDKRFTTQAQKTVNGPRTYGQIVKHFLGRLFTRRERTAGARMNARTPVSPRRYNRTLGSLAEHFLASPASPIVKRKLRYSTRRYYRVMCLRIIDEIGTWRIGKITASDFAQFHEARVANGKIAMAHAVMGMLRTLATFGKTYLNCDECRAMSELLRGMRFQMAKPRTETLTAEQAIAVRRMAHQMGRPSIALGQAFQTDGAMRQKDVTGERVPGDEPGDGIPCKDGTKSQRGILWEEIGEDLVLRHKTSKVGKLFQMPLVDAPMVMEELRIMLGLEGDAAITRDMLPASGPILISELHNEPYNQNEWRRSWRKIATAAGIPRNVFNMDSRSGTITRWLVATNGDLDAVRIAATHSNVATTQRYSRAHAERTAKVMQSAATTLPPTRGRSSARRKASPAPRRAATIAPNNQSETKTG